ncbi:MAG: hypothetical protein K6U89_17980 [Chloroflexi bacterium]|nr:hypothetical protein [Chloroflexota bacterium]
MESKLQRLLQEELENTQVPSWLHPRLMGGLRPGRPAPAPRWSHAALAAGVLLTIIAIAWLAPAVRQLRETAPAERGTTAPGVTMAELPAPLQTLRMTSGSAGWGLAWFSPADSAVTYPQPFYVLKTSDGGKHWLDVSPKGVQVSEGSAAGGYFPDDQTSWVAISQPPGAPQALVVWSTQNGGRTWSKSLVNAPPFSVEGIQVVFSGDRDGWILATSGPAAGLQRKALYRTPDGGRSWVRVALSGMAPGLLPEKGYATGLTFLDSQRGWLGMEYRGSVPVPLYRTTDGGRTWQLQALPRPAAGPPHYGDVYPPRFFAGSQGSLPVAFSSNAGRQVALYRTDDGGDTWHLQGTTPVVEVNPLAVAFASADDVFIADRSQLVGSHDGGRSWSRRPYPRALSALLDKGYAIQALQFSTAADGWLLLARPGADNGEIRELLHTTDGGRSWSVEEVYRVTP